MTRESRTIGIESLIDQVTSESLDKCSLRDSVKATGERFGCGAEDESQKKACALYLWLLGPTTEQLAATCPCRD